MNGHGAFVVTSLFSVIISALVGFAVNTVARMDASAYYVPKIEAMTTERSNLLHQLAALKDLKVRELTITAYSPTEAECGANPVITASQGKVRPGIVAVSRDLFAQGWVFGKKVYVKGHGIFEIADLIGKEYSKRVDIFFPDSDAAKKFGKKQTTVTLLSAG